MLFRSEKLRLITSLGLVIALAFIGIAGVNYQASRKFIREEIINSSLPLLRDTIFSEIHADLMQPIHVSSVMANDTFVKDWALKGEKDVDKITRYLRRIHEQYGFFSAFFVSSRTGNYYHYSDVLKRMSPDDAHDAWYYSFMESGLGLRVDVDTDEASNYELTVFINYRVVDDAGNTIGVTGVGLRLSALANVLADYKRMNGRIVYLVDKKGEVQVHSEVSLVKKATLEQLSSPGLANNVVNVRNIPMDFEYEGEDGKVFLTARYIPEIDWILVVQQPEAAALESARDNMWRTILGGLGVIAVVLLVTGYAITRYQRRLEAYSITDSLTGVYNRRGLEQRFAVLHALMARGGAQFSLAVLDLDGFKQINDAHGHVVGDRLLQRFGELAQASFRKTDVVARWGGDEFMLLVVDQAQSAAEGMHRFRETLNRTPLVQVHGEDIMLQVSCGLTTVKESDTLDSAYLRADRAMYNAKRDTCSGCEVLED